MVNEDFLQRSAHAMQIEFKQKLKLLSLVNGLVDTNGVEV